MKVAKNTVVTIKYMLSDKDGQVIDQSEQENLVYLHGSDYLVPGLENAIENHEVGDKFDVKVDAEQGYGAYNDNLVQEVPISMFCGADLVVGQTFLAETEEGQRPVTIRKIEKETVVVDGNHPLAGVDLYFKVEVVDVREATQSEIEHKHVHSDGNCCCHHHEHEEHEHCCHHHEHEEHKHCCKHKNQ